MWIFTPSSFLSVVEKHGDAKADTLTVRARIAGDIEAVFPDAKVEEGGGTDYRFRARIPREQVAKAMHDQVMGINYSNFKDQVDDQKRHNALLKVWQAMYAYQEASRRA